MALFWLLSVFRSWYISNIQRWETRFFAERQCRAAPNRHFWRVPYTVYQSIYCCLCSLIVLSLYTRCILIRCSFKSGGCTISRFVIWIKLYESCVQPRFRYGWFRNLADVSKFNQVDVCKSSNESVVPPCYQIHVRGGLFVWSTEIPGRNNDNPATECISFAESANSFQLYIELLCSSDSSSLRWTDQSTGGGITTSSVWGFVYL